MHIILFRKNFNIYNTVASLSFVPTFKVDIPRNIKTIISLLLRYLIPKLYVILMDNIKSTDAILLGNCHTILNSGVIVENTLPDVALRKN